MGLRKAIEDALARRAANEAQGVEVRVEDGRVTLSGVVPTWSERAVVLQAARSTSGVREVDAKLRVEPLL